MTAVTFATVQQCGSEPVARRRGRPPAVTHASIADAVLAVGFSGLTYAAVGERLDVSLATLFRHVRGRDELSRLGLDLALRRHPWPDVVGPWRSMLESWAVSAWTLWEQHPGAVVELSRGVLPPALGQLSGQVRDALVDAGFTPGNAVRAVDLAFGLVTDVRPTPEAADTDDGAGPRERFLGTLRVVLAGVEVELAPRCALADAS